MDTLNRTPATQETLGKLPHVTKTDLDHALTATVLANVPKDARTLHKEPFDPLAPLIRFSDTDKTIQKANNLPYGLASYIFTQLLATANNVSNSLEAGLV